MLARRSLFALTRTQLPRSMSTQNNAIDFNIDADGIALLTMKKRPVNCITIEMLKAIDQKLDEVEKNKCKGVIFNSGLPKVYSAGFDLMQLCNPDPKHIYIYWRAFQETCLKLYKSSYTTTVAVNGHTAAGGCVMSVMFDYRVMVNDGKSRIGMNDTAVGIIPQPWICEAFNRVMGLRQAEIALIASTMHTAEEALKNNLIDETAENNDDAIEKCKQFIRRYDHIPTEIKAQTKRSLRAPIIKMIEDNRDEDAKLFAKAICDPYPQKLINTYVQQLKQRKNKN